MGLWCALIERINDKVVTNLFYMTLFMFQSITQCPMVFFAHIKMFNV